MATLIAPQYGQNADVDAAAEVLTADTIMVTSHTWIKALPGNTNAVCVGYDANVTASTGYPLAAGQEVLIARGEVANAGAIYVIGGAANQAVAFRAV